MLCAVDVVVVRDGKILLVRRKKEPFAGKWALPGGIIEEGESAEEAAIREVKEETGLSVKITGLVGVFSKPDRDPRGRVISIAFSAVPTGGEEKAGSDASSVKWFPITRLPDLAFDHSEIVEKFIGYSELL